MQPPHRRVDAQLLEVLSRQAPPADRAPAATVTECSAAASTNGSAARPERQSTTAGRRATRSTPRRRSLATSARRAAREDVMRPTREARGIRASSGGSASLGDAATSATSRQPCSSTRCRASAIISGLCSMPTTRPRAPTPCSSSAMLRPVPQPTSSTVSPPRKASVSIAARRAGSKSASSRS